MATVGWGISAATCCAWEPMVSVTVSVLTGIGIFKWSQALAVILVFTGVWFVTKSRSRRDMEKQGSGNIDNQSEKFKP